jgi:hypothetical protein
MGRERRARGGRRRRRVGGVASRQCENDGTCPGSTAGGDGGDGSTSDVKQDSPFPPGCEA